MRRELVLLAVTAAVASACSTSIAVGELAVNDGGDKTVFVLQSGKNDGSVSVGSRSVTLKHNARAYLGSTCAGSYGADVFYEMQLLGRTLSYTIDLHTVGCACNAAVYATQMPGIGSNGKPDASKSGDYYCDANEVSGVWCPEMDIQEANNAAMHITPHTCSPPSNGYYPSCDRGGKGLSTQSHLSAYGPGSGVIDTNHPFVVNTTFGTDGSGQLSTITTTLAQDGRTHTLTNTQSRYLRGMTDALKAGFVLIFSLWGDSASTMSWLDEPPCSSSTACDTSGTFTVSNILLD